jgi:hypothetical protein
MRFNVKDCRLGMDRDLFRQSIRLVPAPPVSPRR